MRYRALIYVRVYGETCTRTYQSAWFANRVVCSHLAERFIQTTRRRNQRDNVLARHDYEIQKAKAF